MTRVLQRILALVAVLSVMGLQAAAAADTYDDVDAMRCGNQLVTLGAPEFDVIDKCGDPDWVQSSSYWREVWAYDYGPGKFVRYLTFVNGRLQRIQVGGYGW